MKTPIGSRNNCRVPLDPTICCEITLLMMVLRAGCWFNSYFVPIDDRFSKISERQYTLRTPDELSQPIVTVEIDTSNGVMFPLYDPDTNLIYLCGKGDSVIRYFEVSWLNESSIYWKTCLYLKKAYIVFIVHFIRFCVTKLKTK